MARNNSVLIVEDELITAESIRELLEEEGYSITGIATDAPGALLLSSRDPAPDVVICDINIKGAVKGVELAGQLKELYHCEIIFLTAYSDSKTLETALVNDPVMYVVKPYTDAQLLVALQTAFHRIYRKDQKSLHTQLQLTAREKEIAVMVAGGLSTKLVARKLLISIETVKTHRRKMLAKNNISSFHHLVYLMNNGTN